MPDGPVLGARSRRAAPGRCRPEARWWPPTTTETATEIVLPGIVEPEGLLVRHRPVKTPAAGHALVRVEATGVSFAEQGMRRGRYPGQPKFPFVPGYDLVGTVVTVGALRRPAGPHHVVVHPAQRSSGDVLQRVGREPRPPGRFRARLHQDLTAVLNLLNDGVLTAQIAARLPLAEVSRAMHLTEARTIPGKVILTP